MQMNRISAHIPRNVLLLVGVLAGSTLVCITRNRSLGLLMVADENQVNYGRFESEIETWKTKRAELYSGNMPKKLLFVTHARGGSSIGRMMFDTDPGAMFWCEALASYFLAYYGIHYTSLPQRALYTANLTKIEFSTEEKERLSNFITSIFNCEFSSLPNHVLVHPTMRCSISHSEAWKCMDSRALMVCAGPKAPATTCGMLTEISRERSCPEILATVRKVIRSNAHRDSVNTTASEVVSQLGDKQYEHHRGKQANVSLLIEHEICVEAMKRRNNKCFDTSLSRCRSSRFHVLETNRLKMDDVGPVLLANPDMYVIHYVRDPRAIALSRHKLGWTVDHGESGIVEETRFLCKRMKNDLAQRHRLEKQFPGVFLQLRYEDLVEDPVGTAVRAYAHVGLELPSDSGWPTFSAEALHARSDGGVMNVFRANATKSIYKWREEVHTDQLEKLKLIGCEDVLEELNYPMD